MNTEVIQFTESADEELQRLYDELQISEVVDALRNGSLPDDVQALVVPLTTTILDLFGTGTPTIGIDPVSTLKSASRDINLSRILRERGLFRLFRLLNTNDEHNVPLYQSLTDPISGLPFNRREDMIGWFCASAKVSRSVVFMRLATIEKLLGLGYELDQAYKVILTKPSAIRDTLSEVARWVHNELDYVDPDTAVRLAEKFLPADERSVVEELAKLAVDDHVSQEDRDQAQDRLIDAVRPAISRLIDEVAAHQNTKDAMEFVRNDIAGKPEISYTWDYERDELVCEVIVKGEKHGTEYIKDIIITRFIADTPVHHALRTDVTTRMPIKNRLRDD